MFHQSCSSNEGQHQQNYCVSCQKGQLDPVDVERCTVPCCQKFWPFCAKVPAPLYSAPALRSPTAASCLRSAWMSKHVLHGKENAHLPLLSSCWSRKPRSASAPEESSGLDGPCDCCSRSRICDSWALTNSNSVWTWDTWRLKAAWCAIRLCKMASWVVSEDSLIHVGA